jgi:hypothetical protein
MEGSSSKRKTVKDQVVSRINRRARGKPFIAKDFLHLGSRASVDMALWSLTREGAIRRIRRGLYDVPNVNPSLGGKLSPNIDEAARALARRYRWKIIPDGAWAANLLGLSTQVPSKIIYLSDGPNTSVPVGRRTIRFKHARPQAMAAARGKPALVIQALRHLGKEAIDKKTLTALRNALSDSEKRRLVKAAHLGIDWIYELAKGIARGRS